MLTRRAFKPRYKFLSKRLASLMLAPINPSLSVDYERPSLECFKKSQMQSSSKPPISLRKKDGVYQNRAELFWIPDNDHGLNLRLLIPAHAGVSGYREIHISTNSLKPLSYWKTFLKDMESFCRSCLHCILVSSTKNIPGLLGRSLRADKPNHLMDFAYCYI